jgi:hypothetical protein
MPRHRWWARALPFGKVRRSHALVMILAIMLGEAVPARAGPKIADRTAAVDTEHLFGFTEGSDIDDAGDKAIETDSTGRFGKATGAYANVPTELELKYTVTDNFRISAAPAFAYFDIAGLSGIGDRRQAVVQAISFDARFRLLDRTRAPFGLTLSVAPQWGFVDDTSGAPAEQLGAGFLLIADRELVPGWLFGAFNVSFEPDWTRLRATGATERESTLGVAAGLSLQVAPGVFIGGETRYLDRHDGLAPGAFTGQALYAGPALYVRLNDRSFLSAAFNAQIRGGGAGLPGALDLDNFERYQAKLRFGVSF